MNPFRKFALAAVVLTLGFGVVLRRLCAFAIADELYQYIPLMPLISGYLVWMHKAALPRPSSPARLLAGLFCGGGAAALAGYFLLTRSAAPPALENTLGLGVLAWLLCLAGAGCWCLGGATMRALAFPFCLLLFMIPFPAVVRSAIETLLQHGSAEVADWMFVVSGTPLLRDDLSFRLPGINLEVAPECSGIHSSWILLITSLVGGHEILHQPWRRAALALAVIPLALLRNGFRVYVLGELCIHVSPRMIDSPIHHQGGPIFFALSLVPFFLLLHWLRKGEGPRR